MRLSWVMWNILGLSLGHVEYYEAVLGHVEYYEGLSRPNIYSTWIIILFKHLVAPEHKFVGASVRGRVTSTGSFVSRCSASLPSSVPWTNTDTH